MPKIIPFKDTLLVKRRKVSTTLQDGKTKGGIILPETTQNLFTDLADVVEVPELTFSDQHILNNAEKIVESLTKKACDGDCDALKALFEVNEFVKRKSIKVGDAIFMSKYIGTDFNATGETETQTLVKVDDVIGLVIADE